MHEGRVVETAGSMLAVHRAWMNSFAAASVESKAERDREGERERARAGQNAVASCMRPLSVSKFCGVVWLARENMHLWQTSAYVLELVDACAIGQR